MLPAQRSLFDLNDQITYLNCAFMPPQLKSVKETGIQAIQKRSAPWEIKPSDFFEDSEKLRGLVARLLNCNRDNIALIPSVSYGISIAARNVPIRSGQKIILLQDQHPSNVYAWWYVAQERKAEIITVSRPQNFDWTRSICEAITTDTAVVSIPHCHWTDGSKIDLEQIREATRAVGAALVIDASQSLGAFPLNAQAIDADFIVSVGYKWCLGPYGLAYLYVNSKYHSGAPLEYNWISRKGSSNFSDLSYHTEFESGSRRFDMGERSNLTLIPMAIAAISRILEWDVQKIQAYLKILTSQIEREANKLGLLVPPGKFRAGHFIGIHLSSAPISLASDLSRAGIFTSIRGNVLRIAPHIHNSEADIDRLFSVIRLGYPA